MPANTSGALLKDVDKQLRYLGYTYILLLILEGALRKWALPSLSNPLLLIREPVVLLAYFLAFTHKRFPFNRYVVTGFALMLLAAFTTMALGHANPLVIAFGFKVNVWHIPFAFIIGKAFNRNDVIKLGRWWLWATVAMTAIIVLQFYAPQSAWINRAPGGGEGGGFGNVMGRARPPGTFSFIIGLVWFYVFSAAFFIAGITQHKYYSKTLLAISGIALCIALPVSISRSLMLSVAFTFAVGIFLSAIQTNSLIKFFRIGVIACVALLIASQLPVFDEAKEVFAERWERSTREEKGGVQTMIVWRILREFLEPFIEIEEHSFIGEGLGAGTQVGAKLLTGERGFHLGEIEWERLIAEGGIVLGTLYILWRLWLGLSLFHYCNIAFKRGNALGYIFLTACLYNIFVGQWGQISINGFTALGIGLTIASMRIHKSATATAPESTPDLPQTQPLPAEQAPKQRAPRH